MPITNKKLSAVLLVKVKIKENARDMTTVSMSWTILS